MNDTLRIAILGAILSMGTGVAIPQTAAAQEARLSYQIKAGDLDSALKQFASQSRMQLIYSAELVEGKQSAGLTGSYTPSEALGRLLEGKGIAWDAVNSATFVLREKEGPPHAEPSAETQPAPASGRLAESEVQELGKLTVTGTRIRGGTTPSPVITIGIENIREEGFSDLGELIRSIPQNFAGGQNPGVVGAGANEGGSINHQNITGGSSLNLRGIGPDATLTLLNGRRMSYGGFVQAVDIGAIPVEAVDRIEIATDGASAIYGSDAVAGVGNVILRRGYDGVTLGVHYGTATDGGMTTREASATGGTTWSSGGLIAAFKSSSADPIFADQRVYTEAMSDPRSIYPSAGLRSGLFSGYQALGDSVELQLDVLRTERKQYSYTPSVVTYARILRESEVSLASPGLVFSLPRDWSLSISGTWGRDEATYDGFRVSRETKTATHTSSGCYCNESRAYEVGAEGPVFALGGGDARLAAGAGYRTNEYGSMDRLTGIPGDGGDERSRFAYAELSLPLIGPDSDKPGGQRLVLTAAGRAEDYDSFGSVTTPKLGFVYRPSADFTLKASWGRSFKMPTLLQRHQARTLYLWDARTVGGTGYPDGATVLMTFGGNRDLEPERARTSSASLAFHPEAIPGLDLELSWYDINYTDRVVNPVPNYLQGLSNPVYAEYVDYSPTSEDLAMLFAGAEEFYDVSSGAGYDPDDVVAVLSSHYINAASQRIKGIDLSGSYWFDLGSGRLTIRGALGWIHSSQRNSDGQDSFDLSGTLFNPADFKGRIGLVWNSGGLTASAFANHVGGVISDRVPGADEKTSSFTTFDATLRYGVGASGGAMSGVEFALSAQNLLDRVPPLYAVVTPATGIPYDSTNYSAIGRFVSVSASKRW